MRAHESWGKVLMEKSYLFLVGAPKSGTTSLLRGLADSDTIAVASTKEPRFFTDFADRRWQGPKADSFASTIVSDWESYDRLFADNPWRVDGSTDYLSCSVTADRLATFARTHPVKVVAVLRDPVARIISEFQHTLRDGYQAGTLAQSLAAEHARAEAGWHPLFRHVARSRYAAPIRRYRALFGENFRILDFHSIHGQGDGIAAIADFIGISAPDHKLTPHENRSFAPKSAILNTLMNADGLVSFARRVVPDGLRGKARKAATRLNATTYVPTKAELLQMRQALADDIAWCVADPNIPTDHWDLAKGCVARSFEGRMPGLQNIMADMQP